MAVITRKHGVVKLKDATGTPIEVTLGPGVGDFSISGVEAGNVEMVPVYNRGTYLEGVDGDEKQITGSITLYHDGDLTDASTKQPWDGVTKTGALASGVTTDPGGTGASWTTDIVATWTRNAVVHTITLLTCRCVLDYGEAKEGNTITINFTCYQGATPTSA